MEIVEEYGSIRYLRILVRPTKNHVDIKTRVLHLLPRSGINMEFEWLRYQECRLVSGLSNSDPMFPATAASQILAGRVLTHGSVSDPSAVFGARIKAKCEEAGITTYLSRRARIGMYSLRKGGGSEAYKRGINRELLQYHGRWRSAAIDAYIHFPIEMRLACTRVI